MTEPLRLSGAEKSSPTPAGSDLPFVSVIVPCRNEVSFIARCLTSILNNDYPDCRMEILVVDGMSTDGTREEIARFARAHGPIVRPIDNPARILASAWNIGIRESKGEIVFALNAHAEFRPDYLKLGVHWLQSSDVGYVGGVIESLPRTERGLSTDVVTVLSSRFGVGGSLFRTGTTGPVIVDTAAFGAYRREVFEAVGLFDQALTRSQDMDFHRRVRAAGFTILLVPQMMSRYYLRSDLRSFLKDAFRNGFWTTYPLRFGRMVVEPRHLAPLVAVLTALLLGTLGAFGVSAARAMLAIAVGGYFVAAFGAAIAAGVVRRRLRFVLTLPVLFFLLHGLYGIGSLVGLVASIPHVAKPKSV